MGLFGWEVIEVYPQSLRDLGQLHKGSCNPAPSTCFRKIIPTQWRELQRLNKILEHNNGSCLGHDGRTADTAVLNKHIFLFNDIKMAEETVTLYVSLDRNAATGSSS